MHGAEAQETPAISAEMVAQVAQALPLVTPWQLHFLIQVLQARWYRPVNTIEVDTALLLSHLPYALLKPLEHSGKYQLTVVGLLVIKALTR